jgi:exosortase
LFLIGCVLACYWWVVIHQLSVQWTVFEQYHYGWVVPLLCVYLAWRKIRKPPASAGSAACLPSAASPSWRLRGGAWLLALCALAYAPTRFLHEANPIWRLTSLLLALEVIVLTLCFVYIAGGFPAFRRLLFPIAFFLVAVPWPSGLENFVVQMLTRWNVGTTVELLGLLGVPAIQHGNAIEIGAGMVGIDEACSGIRSLQATIMISLFLGEYYLLGVRRRALCVFAGVACSFMFNVVRTSFLTWIGATKGTTAISRWHDPAGVTILMACFLSLWLFARRLARSEGHSKGGSPSPAAFSVFQTEGIGAAGPAQSEPLGSAPRTRTWSAAFSLPSLVLAACALGAWLAVVESGTELWFRSHEKGAQPARVWDLTSEAAGPGFTTVEIPDNILEQFRADTAAHRVWRDADGNAWQLFYFRWYPGHSLDRRVAVQLAKTHGPEKCLPAIGMILKSDLGVISVPVGDMTVAFREYLFTAEGQPLHVFYGLYEDAAGSGVLANRRKDSAKRVTAALAGSRNYGQRLLEIAISGPEQPLRARAALTRWLPTLITIEK